MHNYTARMYKYAAGPGAWIALLPIIIILPRKIFVNRKKIFLKVLTQISKFGILLVSREERADKKRPKKNF